jgi:hypothetical protein
MDLLPVVSLPAHKPRRFVPPGIDLGDWEQLQPRFDQLEVLAPRAQPLTGADVARRGPASGIASCAGAGLPPRSIPSVQRLVDRSSA